MASVFKKVPVSERIPTVSGMYVCIDKDGFIFMTRHEVGINFAQSACYWLDEIELVCEDAARQFANEMAMDGHYSISEIDAFVDGFNYLYEDLK